MMGLDVQKKATFYFADSRAVSSAGLCIGVIISVMRWFEVWILLLIMAMRCFRPGVVLLGVGLAVLLNGIFSGFLLLSYHCFVLDFLVSFVRVCYPRGVGGFWLSCIDPMC